MDNEERELLILKHIVSYPAAIDRIKQRGVTDDFFAFIPEKAKVSYHASLFRLANSYFEESGGSLLTEQVLDNKMLELNIKDEHKAHFITLWSKIDGLDYDENDFFDLVSQLKSRLGMRKYQQMHEESLKVLNVEGLQAAMDFVRTQADEIDKILGDADAQQQNINIGESEDYFKKEYETRISHPELYSGVKIGLKEIDDKTFGFRPPQLVVLLAPSSGGKSVQLLNWAMCANQVSNKKILYFSFEMDLWQCYLRHISLLCEVPYSALKSLTVDVDTIAKIVSKLKHITDGAYFHYDVCMEDPTPEYIESVIRDLIRDPNKGKPDMIVVDYIGNMRIRNAPSNKKPWEQQGDAFEKLHILAKRYSVAMLTAQQVNRDTIRENRQLKTKGKTIEYAQDAASGDQRLMHYATYVIGLDPDKENKMVTYLPVKMRDAWFAPFGASWDAEYNHVRPLSASQQDEWYRLKGLNSTKSEEDNRSTSPIITPIEGGGFTATWDGGTQTFDESELVLDEDDFGL